MSHGPIVEMNEDGSFVAHARGADCHLIYDPTSSMGRWLLLYKGHGAEQEIVLSMHSGLDGALKALVGVTEHEGSRFSVRLPDGAVFTRPGNMPAEQVMASLGYQLVESMIAYAIYEAPTGMTDAEATRAVNEILAGYDLQLGSVDRIGDADPSWCFDMVVPFEGYIHKSGLSTYIATLLVATGLEITGVVESRNVGAEVPDASNVLSFPKAA